MKNDTERSIDETLKGVRHPYYACAQVAEDCLTKYIFVINGLREKYINKVPLFMCNIRFT